MKGKQALLFLKKKQRKNFCSLRVVATPGPAAPVSKSFLLPQAGRIFFKKEVLSSC
jgi:hypothetical protein